MGEHNFELDSGQLYFIEPDGSASLIGHVTDTSVESSVECDDILIPITSLANLGKYSFETMMLVSKLMLARITGLYDAVIEYCPDKRVAHLAVNGKTARVRKKNFNRAIKILEDFDD